MVSSNANETMASISPSQSVRQAGRQKFSNIGMNKSIDISDGSTLKKKLASLYESQSGNGGDPTYSARGGSSKRSKRTSEVDLRLKVMQMQRE